MADEVNGVYRTDFGEEQNKSEQRYVYPNRINFGNLNDAPVVTNVPSMEIDFIGHWYNDFGLEKTAAFSNQRNGSFVWYDWSWNHTTNPNYDPSRHPLLGWYQGDNPKVLDWQCYWLATSGVKAVIPAQNIDSTSTWSTPSDKSYWIYQLFNHVKNFKSLKYILWLKGGDHGFNGNTAEPNAQQDDMINNIIANHDNVYCYTVDGKKYPVFYLWDGEGWRGTYDRYNGAVNSAARMKELANKLRARGYDGIAILSRNLKTGTGTFTNSIRQDLQNNGVYLFGSEYSSIYNDLNSTGYNNRYENYANTVQFPQEDYQIINVVTSHETQAPHPSGWTEAGSTPELFKTVLKKAADSTKNSNKPKVVTIYNVAEWAEGGPGLQPNKQDGFGYLEAVRSLAISGGPDPDPDPDPQPNPGKNTKDWLFTKIRRTVNGGANGRESLLEFEDIASMYDASDNVDDFVFNLTIDYSDGTQDEAVANLHYFVKPAFDTGKIFVKVYNDSGADIPNVGFNLEIKRKPPNTAPSITSTFNTTTISQSTSISIPFTVTDAEGGTMTAILTKDGVVSNQSAQVGENVWNVGTLSAGSHTLSIQVRDSGNLLSNTLTFNITVTANTAPSISSTFNTTTTDDSTSISIPYTVTDAEGGTMTAILTKDGVVANQSAQVGPNVWNVGILPAGSHTLSIQVRDSGNLSSNTVTFNLAVTQSGVDPNQPATESIKSWVGGIM